MERRGRDGVTERETRAERTPADGEARAGVGGAGGTIAGPIAGAGAEGAIAGPVGGETGAGADGAVAGEPVEGGAGAAVAGGGPVGEEAGAEEDPEVREVPAGPRIERGGPEVRVERLSRAAAVEK